MKSVIFLSFLFWVAMSGTFNTAEASKSTPIGIGISLSSKAYWDANIGSCVPREKGFCLHIAVNLMPVQGQIFGTIEPGTGKSLVLSFSKSKGIDKETFNELFIGSNFIADGPISFSPELLKELKLPASYSIPAGQYPFSAQGDQIIIYFK